MNVDKKERTSGFESLKFERKKEKLKEQKRCPPAKKKKKYI